MTARFLPAAMLELESASGYYETVSPRLGRAFRQTVRSGIEAIENHHRIGPSVNADTETILRNYFLGRFPYRMIYTIEANEILVVALAHQHRRSDYWRGRVEEPRATYSNTRAAA